MEISSFIFRLSPQMPPGIYTLASVVRDDSVDKLERH